MSPKDNNKKVSAAVRILHQKRDASARATHLMVKNDSLITYESGILGQAAGEKFFPATFLERKIMSTKTSFKRIALVAASALAIAGFSAVPAYAANGTAIAIAVANTTTDDGVALAAADYTSNPIRDALQISSFTVGAGSAVILHLTAVGGTFATGDSGKVTMSNGTANFGIVSASTVLAATASGVEDPLPVFTAPSVAGSYLLTVTVDNASDGLGGYDADTDLVTSVTMVVTDLSAFSSGTSTAYLTSDVTAGTGTSTTDAAFVPVAKSTGQKATLSVDLNRADGSDYAGGTYYVSLDGPGYLDVCATQVCDSTDVDGAATAWTQVRSDSIASDASFNVLIGGDATSGKATIKSYVILADGVTKVSLPNKTVQFYGSITTISATVLQPVATVGTANGCVSATACDQVLLADTPAIVIVAKDSTGAVVPAATITATPTDTLVIASSAVTAVTGGTDANGAGYYNASITGGIAASVGKSTVITFSTTVSGVAITTTATVSLGGSPATVTMAADSASYTAGQKGTITVTVKDSAGNKAADGTYAALFAGASTLSKTVQGSTPAASVDVVDGVATYTFYAPAVSGEFTISNTPSTSVASAGRVAQTITASVEGDQSSSLALDAANAATDAANNAYDEAQNATQAASDALAAVTELATQVTSLIAMVKKLTAAVAKLNKKK